MTRFFPALLILLMVMYSQVTSARSVRQEGTVTRIILSSDGTFGGCLIQISGRFSNDCSGGFATFSCTGEFTTKDVAYRMLDQAQMAFALGSRVFVTVEDSKKHNGFCFGTRIDILSQ